MSENWRRRRFLGAISVGGLLSTAGCSDSARDPDTTPGETAGTDGTGTTPRGSEAGTGTDVGEESSRLDAAFLTDDVDLNLYHHKDQVEYIPGIDSTVHVYQSTDTGGSSPAGESSDGDAYALAYDHETGNVEGPVRIGYNPIPPNDTHGVPSLSVDGDGYLHVFFGSHGFTGPFQYARSENPHDVTSWIHPPSGESGSADLDQLPPGTYPCMTYDEESDAVYVLYRAGTGSGPYPSHDHATLGTSTDNGTTWTDVNEGVLDFTDAPWNHTDAYVCDLGAWAGRVHLTWQIAEGDDHGQPRRHVYHAAYDPSTGRMETMSGVDLGDEVTHAQAERECKIKDTGEIPLDDGGSVGGFNHAYDPEADTAYIPVRYPVDFTTSQLRVLSYEGVSDRSGTWEESERITTTDDPQMLNVHLRVTDDGHLEVADQIGKNGLWRREDGEWTHHDYVSDTPEIGKIQRPVVNGTDEFGWVGREMRTANGAARRITYALGTGQPADAGASYPKAPQNLRTTRTSGRTVTVDWDHGLAGPSGVDAYVVYVDGTEAKTVTTPPPNQPTPRTWAALELEEGSHTIEVSLVTGADAESAKSNSVDVTV